MRPGAFAEDPPSQKRQAMLHLPPESDVCVSGNLRAQDQKRDNQECERHMLSPYEICRR